MRRGIILEVPRLEQPRQADFCGLACLAMVLQYYGHPLAQEQLARYISSPADIHRNGTDRWKLAFAASRAGFEAEVRSRLSFEDIAELLDEGIPLIARTRTWTLDKEDAHYRVIYGYMQRRTAYLYIHDPGWGRPFADINVMAAPNFHKLWTAVGSKEEGNYSCRAAVIVRP